MPHKIHYDFTPNFTKICPKDYNFIEITEPQESSEHDITQTYRLKNENIIKTTAAQFSKIEKLDCNWREVFKIHIESTEPIDSHKPGDAIGLIVPNSDHIVLRLMKLCNISNRRICVKRTGKAPFEYDGTLFHFIKNHMDLSSLPLKIVLLTLANTAEEPAHLQYLCSREGTRDYMRAGAVNASLVDFIERFCCKPSLEDLLRYCEFIKPRYYTLINSCGATPEILLGIIENNIHLKSINPDENASFGHVSSYIKTLHHMPNTCHAVSVCFRQNMLFDLNPSKNLVCFCTGTGIAPFIALYRNGRNLYENICLLYGYRSDNDNLLQAYLPEMENDDKLKIVYSSSSNQEYVTRNIDIIADCMDDVKIFICGNMKMQRDVFSLIKDRYPRLIEEKRVFFDNWQ
ncbi:methionine synthase reductase [Enteropsectra breve]|nr:methionine synthase reductase [Enteropsectra breve]